MHWIFLRQSRAELFKGTVSRDIYSPFFHRWIDPGQESSLLVLKILKSSPKFFIELLICDLFNAKIYPINNVNQLFFANCPQAL